MQALMRSVEWQQHEDIRRGWSRRKNSATSLMCTSCLFQPGVVPPLRRSAALCRSCLAITTSMSLVDWDRLSVASAAAANRPLTASRARLLQTVGINIWRPMWGHVTLIKWNLNHSSYTQVNLVIGFIVVLVIICVCRESLKHLRCCQSYDDKTKCLFLSLVSPTFYLDAMYIVLTRQSSVTHSSKSDGA